jgi:hypothetical protein
VPQIVVSTMPIVRLAAQRAEAARAEVEASASSPSAGFEPVGHARPDLSTSYTPPTNDVERAMCDIWQQMLGIERVGIHDDFFELGGHSLLATQIVSRVRERCSIELSLRSFFESATIARLAEPPGTPGGRPGATAYPETESRKREEIEIA